MLNSQKSLALWGRDSHHLTKNKDHTMKVVYHGSLSSFDDFDHTRGEHSMFGRGIYLTSSAEDAGRYASKDVGTNPDIPAKAEWIQRELGITYKEARDIVTEGNEQIYPLFVQMEKPIVIGDKKPIVIKNLQLIINSFKFAGIVEPERSARRFASLCNYGKNEDDDIYLLSRDSMIKRAMERYDDPSIVQLEIAGGQGIRELMISTNSDGIIINNVDKLYGWMEAGSAHYFVRLPEQIRSVFKANSEYKQAPIFKVEAKTTELFDEARKCIFTESNSESLVGLKRK
jgi:hypothetical protein